MLDTKPLLTQTDFPQLKRGTLAILQVNLGYLCNLSCTHCHVNAGPKRTELATKETIDTFIEFIRRSEIKVLDITGGAPEMNPHFRHLVTEARALGVEVIDRCNLTILNETGYETLPEFLAEKRVVITASLPCYQEQNVSQQRGKGVFDSSIKALRKLNSLGYGIEEGKTLNLVYNPNGAFLPPSQLDLQEAYKKELLDGYGVVFNELLTITNMPISRFGSMLLSKNIYHEYMTLLKESYSENNLAGVMCRSLISVDWQGYIYDCDFNQMLDWPLVLSNALPENSSLTCSAIASDRPRVHLSQIVGHSLEHNNIVVGDHCYGCTAGQGSSCGGALA